MSQEVADWSLKRVIESILFASQRPVSTKDLHGILKSAAEMEKADPHAASFSAIKESALRAAIDELGGRMRPAVARLMNCARPLPAGN